MQGDPIFDMHQTTPVVPSIQVGPTPVGTRKETCPITALAFAGLKAELYKYATESFDRYLDESEFVYDETIGPQVNHPDDLRFAASREAVNAAVKAEKILLETYKAPWANDVTIPPEVELVEFSDIPKLSCVNIGQLMTIPAYIQSPMMCGDDGARGRVDVPYVAEKPTCAISVAMAFQRLFSAVPISLPHGKHAGLHEIGELNTPTSSSQLDSNTPVPPKCDLCTLAPFLEDANRRFAEIHFPNNMSVTDRRYIRMIPQNNNGTNGTPINLLFKPDQFV